MIAGSSTPPVPDRRVLSPAEARRRQALTDRTPSQKPRTRVTAFGLAPRGSASARHARHPGKEVPRTRR